MREFFRGWRRKLGCAALVIACAMCTMWVRSLRYEDKVIVALGSISSEAQSQQGILELMLHRVTPSETMRFEVEETRWYSEELPREDDLSPEALFWGKKPSLDWRRQRQSRFCGFLFATGEMGGGIEFDSAQLDGRVETTLIGFPYWFVAIPFTLLSAYLILCKSRKPAVTTKNAEVPHA